MRLPDRSRLVLVALLTFACAHANVPLPPVPSEMAADTKRGEYLVRNVAVCGGCHRAGEGNPDDPQL